MNEKRNELIKDLELQSFRAQTQIGDLIHLNKLEELEALGVIIPAGTKLISANILKSYRNDSDITHFTVDLRLEVPKKEENKRED